MSRSSILKNMDAIIKDIGTPLNEGIVFNFSLYIAYLGPVYIVVLLFSQLFSFPNEVVELNLIIGFIGIVFSSALVVYTLLYVQRLGESVLEYSRSIVELVGSERNERVKTLVYMIREFEKGFRTYLEWYPLAILIGFLALISYSNPYYALVFFELYSALNAFFISQVRIISDYISSHLTNLEDEMSRLLGLKRSIKDSGAAVKSGSIIELSLLLFNSTLSSICLNVLRDLDRLVGRFRRIHAELKYALSAAGLG
ncbi:hypothetical protein ACSU1N_00915 [Thermogladius sp. 4427co]|uniref:hypothetical protein n=1 Tax=Thermogladius sp. 4427co TaxID=3450718 RepID=UPI003F7ABB03